MAFKNYYETLGIRPSASLNEIRKAYRKLALRYHPDRNPGDLFSETAFRQVAEAYETLADPLKRADYQRSFLKHTAAYTFADYQPELTAGAILQLAEKLRVLVERTNNARINRDALFIELQQLLSSANMQTVAAHADKLLHAALVHEIVLICEPLTYPFVKKLEPVLASVAPPNSDLGGEVVLLVSAKKSQYYFDLLKIPAAIIVALLLCLLIFFLNH